VKPSAHADRLDGFAQPILEITRLMSSPDTAETAGWLTLIHLSREGGA
jgi:hypothetical protein